MKIVNIFVKFSKIIKILFIIVILLFVIIIQEKMTLERILFNLFSTIL